MAVAAFLAITLDPALLMLFTRMDYGHYRPRWLSHITNTITVGKYYPEEKHPISKILFKFYEPVCRLTLKYRKSTIIVPVLLMLSTVPVYLKLGSEFMQPLNACTILYMPTTLPGISV